MLPPFAAVAHHKTCGQMTCFSECCHGDAAKGLTEMFSTMTLRACIMCTWVQHIVFGSRHPENVHARTAAPTLEDSNVCVCLSESVCVCPCTHLRVSMTQILADVCTTNVTTEFPKQALSLCVLVLRVPLCHY